MRNSNESAAMRYSKWKPKKTIRLGKCYLWGGGERSQANGPFTNNKIGKVSEVRRVVNSKSFPSTSSHAMKSIFTHKKGSWEDASDPVFFGRRYDDFFTQPPRAAAKLLLTRRKKRVSIVGSLRQTLFFYERKQLHVMGAWLKRAST